MREATRGNRYLIKDDAEEKFHKLAEVFLRHIRLDEGAVVASYCAVNGEMNPLPLNEALRERGHKISLPVIAGKNKPLVFRTFEPGDELFENSFGIPEPTLTSECVDPEVLLIPLLAFDRRRNRLGYGGGYYDRTIAYLRSHKPVLTLGLAYACQEIIEIPVGPNDVKLDKIVTESGVI